MDLNASLWARRALVLIHEHQFGSTDLWYDAVWLVLHLQLSNPLVPELRRSWAALEQGKAVPKALIASSAPTPAPQARSSLLH